MQKKAIRKDKANIVWQCFLFVYFFFFKRKSKSCLVRDNLEKNLQIEKGVRKKRSNVVCRPPSFLLD